MPWSVTVLQPKEEVRRVHQIMALFNRTHIICLEVVSIKLKVS